MHEKKCERTATAPPNIQRKRDVITLGSQGKLQTR
jgi:hypothetical protein